MLGLNHKLNELTQLLTYMSMQLSAATKMVSHELPKALREFQDIQQLAARLGIGEEACDPKDGLSPGEMPVRFETPVTDYLKALKMIAELPAKDGPRPGEPETQGQV